MSDDSYQQQRQEGANLIIQKANQLAQNNGLQIDKIEWNHCQPIVDRANHVLSITANGKTVKREFPDEWLADYPGRVGTEKANAVLSGIIRELRQGVD